MILVGTEGTGSGARRRSWSQFNMWRNCAKSWELMKIRRVPQRPGIWLPAGTAVHAAIEQYLRERIGGQQ